ncbi:MAG TPA: hypothetical protein VMT57_04465 [Candidatus Thermoplasmatota archaeon]|nr:hypothetical protein [Candidatus Thermoplasmatota archaeon]
MISLPIVVLLLITRKQRVVRAPNDRSVFLVGLAWFFVGLVLMAVYVFMDVPFWLGVPVAVVGLIYQVIGLWRPWKIKEKKWIFLKANR